MLIEQVKYKLVLVHPYFTVCEGVEGIICIVETASAVLSV